MSKKKAIYEPKGRALEYSPLACDLYNGCIHGCKYCYGASGSFDNDCKDLKPKPNILQRVRDCAKEMKGDPREILISFTSDPYFSEEAAKMTRAALEIFEKYDLKAQVLTKGGMAVERDFDILARNKGWMFGSTIIFASEDLRLRWEPNAPSIENRMEAVKKAHDMGIYTWVSIEPVVDAEEALKVMDALRGHVDLWKIGKLNHFPEIEAKIDWKKYIRDTMVTLKGESIAWKKDLINEIG